VLNDATNCPLTPDWDLKQILEAMQRTLLTRSDLAGRQAETSKDIATRQKKCTARNSDSNWKLLWLFEEGMSEGKWHHNEWG
jgi:hypothetical protein